MGGKSKLLTDKYGMHSRMKATTTTKTAIKKLPVE